MRTRPSRSRGYYASVPSGSASPQPNRTINREQVSDRVEEDRILYAAGWDAALRTNPPCEHVHPMVRDSVARVFAPWDGAEAALARSSRKFRAWSAEDEVQAGDAL